MQVVCSFSLFSMLYSALLDNAWECVQSAAIFFLLLGVSYCSSRRKRRNLQLPQTDMITIILIRCYSVDEEVSVCIGRRMSFRVVVGSVGSVTWLAE